MCSGGILGWVRRYRPCAHAAGTANLPQHPQSVPINMLVQIEGTPLYGNDQARCALEFVRTIAVARIPMPKQLRTSVGGSQRDE